MYNDERFHLGKAISVVEDEAKKICSPLAVQFIVGEHSRLVGQFIVGKGSPLVGRFVVGEREPLQRV
jgi:hypothetical protein